MNDGERIYKNDAFNRVTRVETTTGQVQINRYDAEGLRYEMEENKKLVQFIFNENREVVVEKSDSDIKRLIRSYDLWASECEPEKTWYHYASDEQGSTVFITDDNKVCNKYDYDAWGNLTTCEEIIPNRFLYTGQQFDQITQQYYLRARYYNPVIARFTKEDVYRGNGLNLYTYCDNNPVIYYDPSGFVCDKLKDIYSKVRKENPEISAAKAYQMITNKSPLKNWNSWRKANKGKYGKDYAKKYREFQETFPKDMKQRTYIVRNREVSESEFSRLRTQAVNEAWKIEADKIRKGLSGSRDWTTEEKQELLSTGRVKNYQGHHMKSAKAYPDYVDDPNNIQFLRTSSKNSNDVNEHLAAHGGNYQNITNGRYDPVTGKTTPFD